MTEYHDPAADLNYSATGWQCPKTFAELEQELAAAKLEILTIDKHNLEVAWDREHRQLGALRGILTDYKQGIAPRTYAELLAVFSMD